MQFARHFLLISRLGRKMAAKVRARFLGDFSAQLRDHACSRGWKGVGLIHLDQSRSARFLRRCRVLFACREIRQKRVRISNKRARSMDRNNMDRRHLHFNRQSFVVRYPDATFASTSRTRSPAACRARDINLFPAQLKKAVSCESAISI